MVEEKEIKINLKDCIYSSISLYKDFKKVEESIDDMLWDKILSPDRVPFEKRKFADDLKRVIKLCPTVNETCGITICEDEELKKLAGEAPDLSVEEIVKRWDRIKKPKQMW